MASLDAARVAVGEPAPDFAGTDIHGSPIRLSDLRGSTILLVFFPFAFSGICSTELADLREAAEQFDEAQVRVMGISCDSVFALKAWAQAQGVEFDLISDFWPHGRIAQAFGVFDEDAGLAVRGSFLIDADGIVRWAHVNARGERRDVNLLVNAAAMA